MVWGQRTGGHEVDAASEEGFELVTRIDEVENVTGRADVDDEVEVTTRAVVTAGDRAEDLRPGEPVGAEDVDYLGSARLEQLTRGGGERGPQPTDHLLGRGTPTRLVRRNVGLSDTTTTGQLRLTDPDRCTQL